MKSSDIEWWVMELGAEMARMQWGTMRWHVALCHTGANQLILNNQLQHPGTQHKETKAQSAIDIWIGK